MFDCQNYNMCINCMGWDKVHGGCVIHNTVPGGCDDFRPMENIINPIPKLPKGGDLKGGIALL